MELPDIFSFKVYSLYIGVLIDGLYKIAKKKNKKKT